MIYISLFQEKEDFGDALHKKSDAEFKRNLEDLFLIRKWDLDNQVKRLLGCEYEINNACR